MLVLDLTHPLDESTPVYHDARGYADPPTVLTRWIDVGEVFGTSQSTHSSPFRVSRLEVGIHTGTHVDAPAHFVPGGMTVDGLPAGELVGQAIVVDLTAVGGAKRATDLVGYREAASRPSTIPLLLLSSRGQLAPDAVEELAAWHRPLLCVFGSLDGADPDCPATAGLLKAGVSLAVELASTATQVRDGDLLVIAPLALRGIEGAPARVLAIR
jgi:kynurenine formamidase